MTAGRPSKYDPSYCDAIIEAGREGKSWTAFAADIGVARSTINEWIANYPQFSEAASRAKALAASWYEQQQRRLVTEGGSSAQATLIVFGMKNMGGDDWRDKTETAHTGPNGGPVEIAVSDARSRILGRLDSLSPPVPATDDASGRD